MPEQLGRPSVCLSHARCEVQPVCTSLHPLIVDSGVQYKEMRDEFLASLEDRRFLSLADAQKQSLQVHIPAHPASLRAVHSAAFLPFLCLLISRRSCAWQSCLLSSSAQRSLPRG